MTAVTVVSNMMDRSASIADSIAGQLADPLSVRYSDKDATAVRSAPQSLGGGALGIALLHVQRARAGVGDWRPAHRWLSAAVCDDITAGTNAGLYFGAPALAFVISSATEMPGQRRYPAGAPSNLEALDAAVDRLTRARLAAAHARMNKGLRPTFTEYDLICGLAGLGGYHLARHPHADITAMVLSYLVRLTLPVHGPDDALPGWWTDVAPNGARSADFPGGHGNFGMSHGIAAPLAVLSLAMLHGIVVDGHEEAIGRICAWMDAWQQSSHSGPWWPGYITRAQADAGQVPASTRQRPSWCYGTPGVARAQQLAAMALGDATRSTVAENAMLGCLRDPAQLDRLTDPGLCHGLAGVLQATWRMAITAPHSELGAELPRLADHLISRLTGDNHDPEFLDGHAGIALALHDVTTTNPLPGHWDRCLLLG